MILLLSLLVSFTPANATELSVGYNQVCGIDDAGKGACLDWGSPEELSFPGARSISVGVFGCVVDQGGEVRCWQADIYGRNITPIVVLEGMRDAKEVKVSGYTACVIHSAGVKCFTLDWKAATLTELPWFKDMKLKNPRSVAVASTYACLIDGEEIKCAGKDQGTWLNPPAGIAHPRSVAVAELYSCAIGDGGIQCWGSPHRDYVLTPPPLKNAEALALADDFACALEKGRVSCRGKVQLLEKFPIKNARVLAVGPHGQKICVVDDNGAGCWGLDGWGDVRPYLEPYTANYRGMFFPYFRPEQVGPYADFIARQTTLARASYLKEFRQAFTPGDRLTSFLFAALFSPVVLQYESAQFRESIVPKFWDSLPISTRDGSLRDPRKDLKWVPPSPENRRLALASLLSALRVAEKFFNFEERTRSAELLRALGKAQTDPSDENVAEVLRVDETLAKDWAKISVGKNAFLGSVREIAREFLGLGLGTK